MKLHCQSAAMLDGHGSIGRSPRNALAAAISAGLGLGVARALSLPALGGDILRGGAGMGGKPGSPAPGSAAAAVAAQAAANARDVLARNAKVMDSMSALQKSARDLARRGVNNLGFDPNHPGVKLPDVPNGLVIGGLQVAPGVPVNLANPQPGESPSLWRGALLPTEEKRNGGSAVKILQTKPQAVLTWKSFNVGKNTTVTFNQRKGTQQDGSNNWIAFNRILDPSGVPSQILGSLSGDGTVYLINQNGIIFGGSSQVSFHTFVASSLPINDNLLTRGLLNNPDAQFLFSALPLSAGANGTPAFTPPEVLTPSGRVGAVSVQEGAVLSSPSNAAKVGGRVMLVGANVTNEGTISTPDGQTILAAGLQVGVAAHSSSDPSLRGLDVYVGAVSKDNSPAYAGTVTNSGWVDIPRASLMMVGKSVNQRGIVDSSTTVSLNGRVDLLASYDAISNPATSSTIGKASTVAPFLSRATGTLTIGTGSVTRILPELGSAETTIGTTLALNSVVNMEGLGIHLEADSTLLAPGGSVRLRAGKWLQSEFSVPPYSFVFSGGQIYMDPGSLIDVAGSTGASAPVSNNILSVELRGSELADSPLQRNGPFRGIAIQIDMRQSGVYNGVAWVGTPLANASGYAGLVPRSVGELTINGGSVSLQAGESQTSLFDLEGQTVGSRLDSLSIFEFARDLRKNSGAFGLAGVDY